jgi:hypothetical protein
LSSREFRRLYSTQPFILSKDMLFRIKAGFVLQKFSFLVKPASNGLTEATK